MHIVDSGPFIGEVSFWCIEAAYMRDLLAIVVSKVSSIYTKCSQLLCEFLSAIIL